MKHIILYSVFLFSIFSISCRAKKLKKTPEIVKITISYTEEYCGGAAPPDVLLNELATLKLLKNKEIEVFISKDIDSKPLMIITDSAGTVHLPSDLANTVFINLYTPLMQYKDAIKEDLQYYECYKKFLSENLISVSLTEGQKEFSLISLIKCNPCLPPAP